ncbi:MAG TPA: hypothetical protein VHF50_04220 [Solirubrobacterales bacterium]|nr:hypothetical protein [Solirubrobacterales bacterium]
MAQTRKKRRRKHRGTQGGRVDPSRRTSRPRSRQEAKARARAARKSRPASRADAPPTWRSAIFRAVVAAAIFTVLLVFLFGRPFGAALGLGALMLVFYVPAGYYMDTLLWRRRERARIRGEGEGK